MIYALLCGTIYGATYIPTLTSPDSTIGLAGILSRGSARSIRLAQMVNVPHHLSLDEVSKNQANLVIIAVSGEAGIQLARDSLTRGFDVLAEHPWEAQHIQEMCELADKNGRVFHINSHWADQKYAQYFLKGCHAAKAQSPAAFASLITNPRTLYSALDIVRRAIGPFDKSSFRLMSSAENNNDRPLPFKILQGYAGSTLVTIQYQTFTSQVDDGTSALANHHLVIGFKHGHLTLAETASQPIWVPDMSALCAMGPEGMKQDASKAFPEGEVCTVGAFQYEHRGDANRLALERLVKHSESQFCPEEQSLEHLIDVSRTWRMCMDLAGPISYVPS